MSITRRYLLAAAPAISMASVAPALATAIDSAETPENPALLAAYDNWQAAMTELHHAKDDLAWLIDEWRHLWPLAPEEILGGANAGYSEDAERDLAGERIFRDTADLTKRLSKEFRQNNPRCCFFVQSAEKTAADLAGVKRRKIAGRTDKTREANRRWLNRYIAELEERLRAAEEYEAETARIRELSSVEDTKLRVKNAGIAAEHAAYAVAAASAFTIAGIRLKAEVLVGEMERQLKRPPQVGVFGDGYQLARAILSLIGGAA